MQSFSDRRKKTRVGAKRTLHIIKLRGMYVWRSLKGSVSFRIFNCKIAQMHTAEQMNRIVSAKEDSKSTMIATIIICAHAARFHYDARFIKHRLCHCHRTTEVIEREYERKISILTSSSSRHVRNHVFS